MRWVRQPQHEARVKLLNEQHGTGVPLESLPRVYYGFEGEVETLHALVSLDELRRGDKRWPHLG